MCISIVNRTVIASFFLGMTCVPVVVGGDESGNENVRVVDSAVEEDQHPFWPRAIVQPLDWSVLQFRQSERKIRRIELCIYRQKPMPLESVKPRERQIDCVTDDPGLLRLLSDVLSEPVLRVNAHANDVRGRYFSGELGHLKVLSDKDEFVIGITQHGFVLQSSRQNWHRAFFSAGLAMFLDEMLLRQENERFAQWFDELSGAYERNCGGRRDVRQVLNDTVRRKAGDQSVRQIVPADGRAIAKDNSPDWGKLLFTNSNQAGDLAIRRIEIAMVETPDRDDLKQPAFHWATQEPEILALF